MMSKTLIRAAILLLAAAPVARAAPEPVVRAESPRRIAVRVQDCPLAEMLRRLCRSLRCDLWMEPGLDEPVTLTLIDRDIATVLNQALGKSGYVITWRKGERAETIESISVFRDRIRDRPAASGKVEREAEAEAAVDAVVRLTQFDLNPSSGPAMFRGLEQLYASTSKPDEKAAVVDFVSGMGSHAFEADLIRVAGTAGSPPTAFQRAAIRALSNMGTAPAVNCLLDRLGRSAGKEAEELAERVRTMAGTSSSLSALRSAASGGNKRFATDPVRLAAIRSLARFKDGQTLDVLKALAADPSAVIRQAAAAALAGEGLEEDDDEDDDDGN